MLKITLHTFLFIFLTILTQVGGLIYLLTLFISKKMHLNRIKAILFFMLVYLITTFVFLPFLSPFFGRTALPLRGELRPLNITTCFLNRHYVKPTLKKQMIRVARQMNAHFPGSKTNYLDANFPFVNGFPLVPHLSHNDGAKIDLAFYYKDAATGKPSPSAPSFIGYGIYDHPTGNEINQPEQCLKQGYWQYGAITHLIPKWDETKFIIDKERTTALVKLLAIAPVTSKLFIEPHLKNRWGLQGYNKIRFHGCQAVRHDDHIHTQI